MYEEAEEDEDDDYDDDDKHWEHLASCGALLTAVVDLQDRHVPHQQNDIEVATTGDTMTGLTPDQSTSANSTGSYRFPRFVTTVAAVSVALVWTSSNFSPSSGRIVHWR